MIAKTYVVPLDGSPFAEKAVPVAAAFAQRTGGALLLVSAPFKGPLEPRTYLAEVAARYPNVPIETLPHVDHLPADAILKVAGESDDRIVCMTSHGRGRVRWSVLGSTAEELIRRTDRPVLLVGRNCRDDFLTPDAHLLACVDGTECSAGIAAVARAMGRRARTSGRRGRRRASARRREHRASRDAHRIRSSSNSVVPTTCTRTCSPTCSRPARWRISPVTSRPA